MNRVTRALDRPLRRGEFAVGWVASTAVVFLIALREGVAARGDDWAFMTPATLIAHGYPSCAYAWSGRFAPSGPGLPLLLAGLLAATRIGMGGPFRVTAHFAAACRNAYTLAASWWTQGHRETLLLGLSTIGWVALLAGVTLLLRTTSRGRTGWEVLTCLLLALVPPVFMTMTSPAHPEYPLALGLALGGWALLRRGRAVAAGVLLGLAAITQASTLLVAVPLVLWSGRSALRVAAGAVAAAAAVAVPLDVVTRGRIASVLLGSGLTVPNGTTWIDHLGWHGDVLRAVSRGAPLALATALALLARRVAHAPPERRLETSLAIVGACLTLRLVFEVSVWGYYFSAVALTMVLVMIVGRRWWWGAVVWIAVESAVFNPSPHLYWVEGIPHVPEWAVQVALAATALALFGAFLARAGRPAATGAPARAAPASAAEGR